MRIFIIFLLLVSGLSNGVYGQRGKGGGVSSATRVRLTPTITNTSCFSHTGGVSYIISVSTGWNKFTEITKLDLIDANGNVVYTHSDGGNATGSVSELPVGNYTFVGYMTVLSNGFLISVLINVPITIGVSLDRPYAKVERKIKGVKYRVCLESFYFYTNEEYQNFSGILDYNVYSTSSRSSSILSGTVLSTQFSHGDNRYSLNVSSLASGSYILEVINEKNEKFYLRFIK